MIENILLGFLMYGEMTGYDLKQFMGQSTANFYDASYGSIYPALKRLEKAGYVAVRVEASGNRPRKIYALLDQGRQRFLEWMTLPLEISKNSTEALIRVFFLEFIEKDQAKTLILNFENRLRQEILHLETIEPRVKATASAFQQATLSFGKGQYAYQIAWCEQIITLLEEPGERSKCYENYSLERQS